MSRDTIAAAVNEVEELLAAYEREASDVERLWREFRERARGLKTRWDMDLVTLKSRMSQIESEIRNLRENLDALAAKKELGIIGDDEYGKLYGELSERIGKLSAEYEDLQSKYELVDRRVRRFWALSLDEEYLASVDIGRVESDVERLYGERLIDEDTYNKIKRDIELLKTLRDVFALV